VVCRSCLPGNHPMKSGEHHAMKHRNILNALIVALLALSFLPLSVQRVYAVFSSPVSTVTQSIGENGGTSSSIDTTGANLLVACVSFDAGGSPTLSDSKTNSWTSINTTAGGSSLIRLYYSVPSSVGSGHNFTIAGSATFAAISVQAWAGAHATPLDQNNHNTADPVSSVQPGSVTPTDNGQLLVTCMNNTNDAADSGRTINSSFTVAGQKGLVGSVSYGIASGYFVQTTAAAINPTWSWSSGAVAARAAIATFKESGGGGGGSTPCFRALLGVGCHDLSARR
jgi:hypothetical protein